MFALLSFQFLRFCFRWTGKKYVEQKWKKRTLKECCTLDTSFEKKENECDGTFAFEQFLISLKF